MLTQLELFGFKSFADRTVFGFAPGITCVVGPNGSGKSNVVDAIKWILGDQSPKSLRGQEMADVIFNGSAGRKPSGYAEATLTFNNESRLLLVDAPVVQVGRRLYRSGESEYLLNGAVVRLKDVRDAFMGTGAGTSAYSIIEQGRVDQILQTNPTTRRVVFEEAAGISRYKHRRIDAERKLERVAQNLARLTDIVREVEAQLTATRNQASRAARYREVSQELRALWTGLAADDCRHLGRELAADVALAARNRGEVQRLGAELTECDTTRLEIERSLAAIDEELQSLHRQLSTHRESVASRESTIRHQSARQRELDADVAELRRERLRLNTRVRAMAGELLETAARLERFDRSLQDQRSALADRDALVAQLQQQAAGARERLAEQRRRQQELAERRTEHAGRASILVSQSRSTRADLEEATALRHALESAVERARGEHAARVTALDEARQTLGQAAADVERLHGERLRLLDEQGHSEQSLGAMRDQRVAWEARIHVLEDLERRQEGLGLGVREILRRAEQIDLPPWNSILGCVGTLLDVPLEHAALLELALGQRAQLIVTGNLDAVAEYLNRADAPITGRVGFLGLDDGPQRPQVAVRDELDLSGEPGVVARADRLATDAPEVAGLAARLLAGTWVVEALSVARRIAAAHPGRCRFVTLQGELIDADGTLHAGTVPHETSLVSRKSELRRLRSDLQRLDDDIAEQFRELTALGLNLTGVDGSLAEAEEHKQQLAERLSQARLELAAQERELQRQSGELERQVARTAEFAALERQQSQDLAAAQAGVAECEAELAAIEDAAHRAERDLAEIERTLGEVAEELQRQQLELAKHEERVHGLREAQSRLEREQGQRQEQLQQAAERMRAADQARQTARLNVLNSQSAIAELTLETERLDARVAHAESQRAELRLRRGALHRREDELHRRRRELTDAQHDCELRIRETRQQLAALEQRIEEEYQVRLADLVAEGASAFARWRPGGEGMHLASGEEPPAGRQSDGADVQPSAARTPPVPPSDPGQASTAFFDVRPQIEEEVQRLRRKLKSMGHVNTEALESLDELESRFVRLSGQLQDLTEAKSALEEIIRRINGEGRRMFVETFESIRTHFRELFRKLFGGGEADIVLEDPSDVLECGIDIVARPPGKELRSITLLSGGEKTLTAIALLFAMFKSRPSPYCILDEVDAALDEANVERYASILHDFVQMTQFVVITHRKRTMTAADVIYGVTMEQAGVSKRMSVRFEEVGENGEIRTRSGRAA